MDKNMISIVLFLSDGRTLYYRRDVRITPQATNDVINKLGAETRAKIALINVWPDDRMARVRPHDIKKAAALN